MLKESFLRLLKSILIKNVGKTNYQNVFEYFYSLSLTGMNIGDGADTGASGEKHALFHIIKKLQNTAQLTIFDVGANIGLYTILLNYIFQENA